MNAFAAKSTPLRSVGTRSSVTGDNLFDIVKKIAVALLFVCEFLVIYKPNLEIITGPILTVCMIFLMFTDYFYVPMTVIIVPLGTLGTIFAGKIAIYYLLFPLLLLRITVTGLKFKVRLSDFTLLVLGALHILQLMLIEGYMHNIKTIVYMAATICWFIYIRCLARGDDSLVDKVLVSLAVCITVNALASMFTDNVYSKYTSADRLGIAGAGTDDPNIAAMYLCIAFAILLSSQNLKIWMKIPLILLISLSLISTVSISGLLAFAVIAFAFVLFMNKNRKNVLIIVSLVVVLLIAISVFPLLGLSSESEINSTNYLEYYQTKLEEKIGHLQNRNFDDATSDRTVNTTNNLEYFSAQPIVNQIFGGNSANPLNILVSHNSFADILLRFGYFGLFTLIIIIIYGTYKQLIFARNSGNCTLLMCKIALLYWSLTLSLYEGMSSCMWMTFLLMF